MKVNEIIKQLECCNEIHLDVLGNRSLCGYFVKFR